MNSKGCTPHVRARICRDAFSALFSFFYLQVKISSIFFACDLEGKFLTKHGGIRNAIRKQTGTAMVAEIYAHIK